jgi:hypothetical protein
VAVGVPEVPYYFSLHPSLPKTIVYMFYYKIDINVVAFVPADVRGDWFNKKKKKFLHNMYITYEPRPGLDGSFNNTKLVLRNCDLIMG